MTTTSMTEQEESTRYILKGTDSGDSLKVMAQAIHNEIQQAISEGIHSLPEFTTSDTYVALDIARCTLEAIFAQSDPVDGATEAIRRWKGNR